MKPDAFYNLLIPAHVRYSDDSKAYQITCGAFQNEWEIFSDLIKRISICRSPWKCDDSVLDVLATDLGVSNYYSIPPNNRRLAIAAWTRLVKLKGTAQSLKEYAGFLGYDVGIHQLYCSFGYANLVMVPDENNDYRKWANNYIGFNESIGFIVDNEGNEVSGRPVDLATGNFSNEVAEFVRKNNKWTVYDSRILDGESEDGFHVVQYIDVVYNSSQMLPAPGQIVSFQEVSSGTDVIQVISCDVIPDADDPTRKLIRVRINKKVEGITRGSIICIYYPGVIYSSSYYDVDVVIPEGKDEYSYFEQAKIDLQKLSAVAPFRTGIRQIRKSYKNQAQVGWVWKDFSIHQNAYKLHTYFPIYNPTGMGDNGSVDFSEYTQIGLPIESSLADSFRYRSINFTFETTYDISSRQVLWTQGDENSGIVIYIYDGKVWGGFWKDGYSWFKNFLISRNKQYYVSLNLNFDEGFAEFVLSGVSLREEISLRDLGKQSGEITICGVISSTRFSDTFYSSNGFVYYSGFSGISGYSGFANVLVNKTKYVCGYSGYSGLIPFVGHSGYIGFSGFDNSGTQGYSGYSGDYTYIGYSGYSGMIGYCGYVATNEKVVIRSGYSGFVEYSGFSGYSGINGSSFFNYIGSVGEIAVFGDPYSSFDKFSIQKRFSEKYTLDSPIGSFFMEEWTGIGSELTIDSVTSNRFYPDFPDTSNYISGDYPLANVVGSFINSGSRIQFYFVPDSSGLYRFKLSIHSSNTVINVKFDSTSSATQLFLSGSGIGEFESDQIELELGKECYIEILTRNLSEKLNFSLSVSRNSGQYQDIQFSEIKPNVTLNPSSIVVPDLSDFSFNDQPKNTTYVSTFYVPFASKVSSACLVFKSTGYNTVQMVQIRLNDYLIKLKTLELNIEGDQYRSIDIPLSRLRNGDNIVTFKLTTQFNEIHLSDIKMFCSVKNISTEIQTFENLLLYLVPSRRSAISWTYTEKQCKSYINQSNANEIATFELVKQLKEF